MPSRIPQSGFGLVKRLTRLAQSAPTIARRTFITSTFKRPSLTTQSYSAPSTAISPTPSASAITDSASGLTLDLVPKISAHPALAGIQIRNGPRNTTFNITHFKRKRRVGFLARKRSRTGLKILKRRMLKRRSALSH